MSDIRLSFDNASGQFDITLSGGDIVVDDGLETAVIVSFFTDRHAGDGDAIPDGGDDLRGWWGDAFPDVPGDLDGSREWLLERAKIVPETLRLLEDFSREALAWMVRDGVAKSVMVEAGRLDTTSAGRQVTIKRPDGTATTYDYVWRRP